jgi:hypothetical protein
MVPYRNRKRHPPEQWGPPLTVRAEPPALERVEDPTTDHTIDGRALNSSAKRTTHHSSSVFSSVSSPVGNLDGVCAVPFEAVET